MAAGSNLYLHYMILSNIHALRKNAYAQKISTLFFQLPTVLKHQ